MARVVLTVGEVVLLQFAARVLERTVSLFVFCLEHWLTLSHVAGHIHRRSRVLCSGDSGDGKCGVIMGAADTSSSQGMS
jgi:hypothetical protein